MDLQTLHTALQQARSKETCFEPVQHKRSSENPSHGQCYVTSMIVQDYFGGDILKAKSTDGTGHYRNRVNGIEVDFTKEQFPEHIVFPEPITIPRIEMVEQERYQILVEKVERILEKSMSYG